MTLSQAVRSDLWDACRAGEGEGELSTRYPKRETGAVAERTTGY
jgi:hypothetical protein